MLEILDARQGAVDHACRGCWQYAGLNKGGHEVYRCDSGKHVIIAAHVAADHRCGPDCAGASLAA